MTAQVKDRDKIESRLEEARIGLLAALTALRKGTRARQRRPVAVRRSGRGLN